MLRLARHVNGRNLPNCQVVPAAPDKSDPLPERHGRRSQHVERAPLWLMMRARRGCEVGPGHGGLFKDCQRMCLIAHQWSLYTVLVPSNGGIAGLYELHPLQSHSPQNAPGRPVASASPTRIPRWGARAGWAVGAAFRSEVGQQDWAWLSTAISLISRSGLAAGGFRLCRL